MAARRAPVRRNAAPPPSIPANWDPILLSPGYGSQSSHSRTPVAPGNSISSPGVNAGYEFEGENSRAFESPHMASLYSGLLDTIDFDTVPLNSDFGDSDLFDRFGPKSEPLSTELISAGLSQLPSELILIILDLVRDPAAVPGLEENWNSAPERRRHRSSLARTSLVCRSWWITQRPMLFADLRLGSAQDVHVLLEILQSRRDDWLPDVIAKVHISTGNATDRLCRLLTQKLPSLRELLVSPGNAEPFARPPPVDWLFRPSFTSCNNLRRLRLLDIKFASLSALSHLLADISTLEELLMARLSWVNRPERPPTRMSLSSFPRLRHISCRGEDTGMLLWLYAPLLARRCATSPRDVTSSNLDVKLLVYLLKHWNFWLGFRFQPSPLEDEVPYEAEFIEPNTLQIKSNLVVGCLFVCEMTVWPSDVVSTNDLIPRSTIGRVKILDLCNILDDDLFWEPMAVEGFGKELMNTKTMAIHSGCEARRVKERVRKLFGSEVKVRPKEEWDGCYHYENGSAKYVELEISNDSLGHPSGPYSKPPPRARLEQHSPL